MSNIILLTELLKERYSTPPGWSVFRWEVKPHYPQQATYYEFEGVVAPLCTKGPRKGWPNFRKEDKSTRMTMTIAFTDAEKLLAEWSERTGKCSDCSGKGKTVASCSVETGTTYRDCYCCKGTGKAQGATPCP